MNRVLITGSAGLVGSECARHYAARGWHVSGIDNDQRGKLFGTSTEAAKRWLCSRFHSEYEHFDLDIRDADRLKQAVNQTRPELVIHAAAQPSHDWAASDPRADFDINAGGTLNLLEAVRRHCPDAVFVFLSTNKVYGDRPNNYAVDNGKARYYPNWAFDEDESIDQCMHSLFGCSKAAADLYVQEYGRYFAIKTCCFRCGCLTGSRHAAAEQHGFLAWVFRAARERRRFRIFGYGGKQVRDNLHAVDVARAIDAFASDPKIAAVYNLGGGRANSCSVLEAIDAAERRLGLKMETEYVPEHRKGDHIAYVTDLRKWLGDYPGWTISRDLESIYDELAEPEINP